MSSINTNNLTGLPSELLIKICQELSRPDLGSLRLTCSLFTSIAAQQLYSIVYLTMSLTSFQSLQRISQHPGLRKYVRVLDIDPRTICSCDYDPPCTDTFEDWREDHAGNFEGIDYMGRLELLDTYPEPELQGYFAKWLEYLDDEKALIIRGIDVHYVLLDSISQCPNLNSLLQPRMLRKPQTSNSNAHAGFSSYIDNSKFALDTLSGRQILFSPVQRPRQWGVLQSLHLAKKTSLLTAFDGVDLHLSDVTPRNCPQAWEFPALRKLSLIFVHKKLCHTSNFSHMMSSCLDLQELKLVYRGHLFLQSDRRALRLSCIISSSQHWAGLRYLSMEHLRMTGTELRNVLLAYKSSLRSLELHAITLDPEFNTKGEEEITSWLDIIEFLREELFLTAVRFSGLFSNGRNEAWVVAETSRECSPIETLKCRIQAYICAEGENPIVQDPSRILREANKYDIHDHEVPYIFDDETWQFADHHLPHLPLP
ncbi:hypothetical protein BKA65DRAFT_603818 [Rhexocercosporidium sp. MPI-PUGE-AT-0058]|nr:hypothetical protein BKA65DRAFT_603818 [Rhexocercosporidium sp. MPI-PUGE-AT-0058]